MISARQNRLHYSYNQAIALMPRSLRECPTRGWPWQNDLHLSLSIHSLQALKPHPTSNTSFIQVFLHPIFPSSKWSSSPTPPLHTALHLHRGSFHINDIHANIFIVLNKHQDCILISETPGLDNQAENQAAFTTGKYTTPFKKYPTLLFFPLETNEVLGLLSSGEV